MSNIRTPEISKQDGVTVISLGSEYENLDEHGLDDLTDFLLDVANTADPALVVLDMSHTTFFASAFIEVLFRIWNRLSDRDGGRFCISGLTPHCAEVIKVTHLDRLWNIAKTRDEAVRMIRGN